jgi:hypothetical protein
MSRTNKHRIEGLYHNGLISVEDVPISVKRGWDRHNAKIKAFAHRTGRHEKIDKRDKEMRLDGFVDAFKEQEYERTYKGLDEK